MNPKRILLSRTDSIGDVILTLPMAGIIKDYFPGAKVYFMGKTYTKSIIQCARHVDSFINWSDFENIPINEQIERLKEYNIDTIIHVFPDKTIANLAKRAGIKTRIGTAHRIFHWTSCNKLPAFSRKNSDLHEAQLNCKLLQPLGINKEFTLEELADYNDFKPAVALAPEFSALLDSGRKNIILHTKSKGSAREWGLENFRTLINLLDSSGYQIFLSGTEEEGRLFRQKLLGPDNVVDISGKMSLEQFISFIARADALIAASTGPLHIAAALGINALGIYPPIKPMHPGRWKPIGPKTAYLVEEKDCSDCRNGSSCHCMLDLGPERVKEKLEQMLFL
jgi:ADP-heptose:LPS heptosyltransferase